MKEELNPGVLDSNMLNPDEPTLLSVLSQARLLQGGEIWGSA